MNKGKFYRDTYSAMTPESYDSIHPRCGIYHGSHKCRDGYVYVARGDGGAVKIGHTSSVAALRHRMYDNRRVYGMGFTLLFMLRTHCARGLEAKIHKALEVCRDTNAGGDELFRPDDQQLSWVSRIDSFVRQPVVLVPAIDLL